MAGIQGQPAPKPSNLKSPVPDEAPSFEDFAASPGGDTAPDFADFAKGNGQPQVAAAPAPQVGYQGPGSDTLAAVADALPAVGGVVGGIAGGATPLSVPLAMTGAIGGTAWKQVILQDVLGRVPQQGALERMHDMGTEGETAGLGGLIGLGLSKGVAKAASTKYGQAALDYMAETAAKPLAALKQSFESARGEIFDTVDKMFASKITPLNSEQAGNQIKSQLTDDIRNKFSGFVKAYGNLDNVAQDIPLRAYAGDLAESTSNITLKNGDKLAGKAYAGTTKIANPTTELTDNVRDWAIDMPPGTYKNIKAYTDQFDQVTNGRGFLKVLGDLRTEAESAATNAAKYNSNAIRDRAAALTKFADEAETHYEENIVGGIAKRVAEGKSTPAELEGFQRMMAAQQNPNVPVDPKLSMKYAQSVANDYLKQKDAVKKSYAEFRGLLEDIGDVTKVKAQRMGPRQFANALDAVPGEKLAERAFDPKNANALRTLKDQYPMVYDTIVKNKMSDIIAKNTSVSGEINYEKIASTIKDMPKSTSQFLLKSDEYATLLKAVNDPRLPLLKAKEAGVAYNIVHSMASIGEIMRTGGKQLAKRQAPLLPNASQVLGQGAARLSNSFYPGVSQPQMNPPPQEADTYFDNTDTGQ